MKQKIIIFTTPNTKMGCLQLKYLNENKALEQSPLFLLPSLEKKEVPGKNRVNYSTFGMQMPEPRHHEYTSDKYRFGYNGMEMDDEVSGDGNSYTTEFRQYDPRLGRWKSLDPLMHMFPSISPYCAFDNNPIYFVDPYGLSSESGPEEREGSSGTKAEKKYRSDKLLNIKNAAGNGSVIFIYKTDKGTSTYEYTYDGEAWDLKITFVDGHHAKHQNVQLGSPLNKMTEQEANVTNTVETVENQEPGIKVGTEIIKKEAGISEGKEYSTNKGKKSEYYRNTHGKTKPLYGKTGAPKNSGLGKLNRNIKVVDGILGTVSNVTDYSQLGYHISQGNVGPATEKLLIIGLDKVSDYLLLSPTPATVAVGVIIKGGLYIYENWESFQSAFSWLTKPAPAIKHTPYYRPADNIYKDRFDHGNFNPLLYNKKIESPKKY